MAVPLESLLFGSDTNYERITNSKPDVGGDTFRDAFKNAYIRFTHFVRAGDESAVSTEAVYLRCHITIHGVPMFAWAEDDLLFQLP